MLRIGFIGFGEAARAFAATLRQAAEIEVAAYDILVHDAGRAALEAAAGPLRVRLVESAAEAVAGADLVVSAVTAAAAGAALEEAYAGKVAPHVVFDINSVTARRKEENAARVRSAGATYLDMAVMAPVHPRGHRTPVLVAGDVEAALPYLETLGFAHEAVGPEAGQATAVKMVRSLFVKGLEAITAECLTAAAASGCGERVLSSLAASFPGLDLPQHGRYVFDRVSVHGARRAEEMREVAQTLRDLGLTAGGRLADAIADVQAEYGSRDLPLEADALAIAAVAAGKP